MRFGARAARGRRLAAHDTLMPQAARRDIRALFVTGAYHPDISAGGVQCRDMARLLAGRVNVRVLTTTWDRTLSRHESVDGVSVTRVAVDVNRRWSKAGASVRLIADLVPLVRWCEVVHVQGTSAKNLLVTAVAKLFRRRLVISLQTAGHDEPAAIARQGRLAWWAFTAADAYLAVSPALLDAYLAAGLPRDRITLVPNGVDTERFRPATDAERQALRHHLHLPDGRSIVAFVGYFSHDKQPQVLFDAWCRLLRSGAADATLLFVGATRSAYFEVDDRIVERMREEAARIGVSDHLVFTGPTHLVHEYLRAADVFALPSRREGAPVALLEAMACGLPCVASRLPGSTDAIIDDGINGVLVPPGDSDALSAALEGLLRDRQRSAALAAEARASVLRRFTSAEVARCWLSAYRDRKEAA